MSELHIYTDDYEFVIAADPADALAVLRETHNAYQIDPEDLDKWPDDKPFTLYEDESRTVGATKLPAEWAIERGRGWLAATEG